MPIKEYTRRNFRVELSFDQISFKNTQKTVGELVASDKCQVCGFGSRTSHTW